MKSNTLGSQLNLPYFPPRFSAWFLKDHAGLIMSDPKIALVELVANSWDAGADSVSIEWPDGPEGEIEIGDNGIGMTYDEFRIRWPQLSYNRINEQGVEVEFPPENRKSSRKAFGRNGKGRHGMFCFSNTYTVETWRNSESNVFRVSFSNDSSLPFNVAHQARSPKEGHGTILSANLLWNPVPIQEVRDLIGSKFVADPSFNIFVNSEPVELMDLEHLSDLHELEIPGYGKVLIRHFYSDKAGRTSKQHGVAWWVNKRLVGEPSWKGFDDNPYLDARRSQARHHTFVVEADILYDQVKDDWSGFNDSQKFTDIHSNVKEYIFDQLHHIFQDVHRERKISALESNVKDLQELPKSSQFQVGKFLDEIQRIVPTIGQRELSASVQILAKLEKSRTGFILLEQLAQLDPNDLDALSDLLGRWTIQEASIVLEELQKRLKLIDNLERLVENPSSDELHEIQPLFEMGLWIFGPEYEGISFTSNRSLLTVIKKLLKDHPVMRLSNPKKRPDFVALPDSTLGIYSRDSYDQSGEVDGIDKLLIVELKRGGFEITRKERSQAQDYASELRKSGKIQRTTIITGFVLGSTIADDSQDEVQEGNTTIFPKTYSTVLRQAHARTFNLLKKLDGLKREKQLLDPEVEKVIKTPRQLTLN
jgi:hypothetical protein